jgi:hypothetical protein
MDRQSFGDCDFERFVLSGAWRYSGRCDRFGVINGHLAVLDYKSGGDRIYPETWLQLSAYELAIREELEIAEPIWHYAVHLNKKTGVCTPYVRSPDHTARARDAWLALVVFDRAMRQVPTDAQMAKAGHA